MLGRCRRIALALVLGAWPVVASAAPPTLPGLPGAGMSTTETTRAAEAPPVQRPAGMASEPPPATIEPRDTCATPTQGGTQVGPQPPPVQPPVAAAPIPEEPAPTIEPEPEPEPTTSQQMGLAAQTQPKKERFPHAGKVLDFRLGTQGCIGGFCRTGAHDVTPGIRLGGFVGGNIRGWFEAGLGAGWGTMGARVTPGTNALVLYGLDPWILQQALAAQAAGLLQVDLAGLAVQDAKVRTLQVGPSLRVHFLPRGRMDAFLGAGIGYNRLRTMYETAMGQVDLDFHGIAVPVEANVSVYVHRNVALGVQFDYAWTWYGVAVLDHPQQRVAIPVSVLDGAAQQQGSDLRSQLPQLWNVGLALRGRL